MPVRPARSTRVALVAVLLAVSATLTGCAATPAPADTAAPDVDTETSAPESPTVETEEPAALLDACALLPRAEAEALAGAPLAEGITGNPEEPSCMYTGSPEGPVAQVEVYTGPGAESYYNIDVNLGHVFTPVPGIADEAQEEDGTIFLRSGTMWVVIRLVRLNDPAENIEPLREAARAVAGRL